MRNTEIVLDRIQVERLRQERDKEHTCINPDLSDSQRFDMLLDVVLNLASTLIDQKTDHLLDPMLQIATIATAWCERLIDD